MSGRIHVVRSAFATPAQRDRAPAERRRRDAPDCNAMRAALTEAAATIWRDRWSGFYGNLGPMLGAASAKPLTARVGLLVVCLSLALGGIAPAGAQWSVSLTTTDDRQPVRLVMFRRDLRHAVPVRLDERSLRVGAQPPVGLGAPRAGMNAMSAFAAEIAAFFGAVVRSEGA